MTTKELEFYSLESNTFVEDGKIKLAYWPMCTVCHKHFIFDKDEPFAYCECGTTEWGDPRPADWVTPTPK